MDDAIIRYYRDLLKADFPNAGELAEPSAFVESVGGRLVNCGNTGNFMQLYVEIRDWRITEIKYLCQCEPVANVAVEVLCSLARGLPLEQVKELSEEIFFETIGSRSEELQVKIRGLLELLSEGISEFLPETINRDEGEKKGNLNWDDALSL